MWTNSCFVALFWSDAFQSNKTLVSTHSVPKLQNNNKNQKTHKKKKSFQRSYSRLFKLWTEHHTKCLKLINADILVYFGSVWSGYAKKKYLLGLEKQSNYKC